MLLGSSAVRTWLVGEGLTGLPEGWESSAVVGRPEFYRVGRTWVEEGKKVWNEQCGFRNVKGAECCRHLRSG